MPVYLCYPLPGVYIIGLDMGNWYIHPMQVLKGTKDFEHFEMRAVDKVEARDITIPPLT